MALKFCVSEVRQDRLKDSPLEQCKDVRLGLGRRRVQDLPNVDDAPVINKSEPKSGTTTSEGTAENRAVAHFEIGHSSVHLEVQMTPAGLLAVGALVSAILLSVVPIVGAATRDRRQK